MSVNVSQTTVGIRARRLAAGFSQQRLAERARCSVGYVRLLESGYTPGESEVLERIARALNDVEPAGDGLDEKTREHGARHASG